MIDMTRREEDKKDFIVDISHTDTEILVDYADGHSEVDKCYTLHNYNIYRRKMINQINKYGNDYMIKLSKESFKIFIEKYIPIILSVVGLYFAYNMDIHVVIKVLLTIGAIILNGGNMLFNEIWCTVMAYDFDKLESYLHYSDHINSYVINNVGDDHYILPIEDIDKHDLSFGQVKEIGATVDSYREQYGDDIVELNVNYTLNKKGK